MAKKSLPELTFMVIDDEPEIGEGICFIVGLAGHKTACFTNPTKAVKEYKENQDKYSAIFTDLRMPEMNGEEVIAKIRKINTQIPIIIVTGTRGIFTTDDLVKLNVPSLISKPFEMKDIELAVKAVEEKYLLSMQ